MGIGLVAITTSQKREITGPFPAGVAVNGTSIDALGKVVLGNDVGDPLNPAILLNNREINMGIDLNTGVPFSVAFRDTNFTLAQTVLNGGEIQQIAQFGSFVTYSMEVATGGIPDRYDIAMFGGGAVQFLTGIAGTVLYQQVRTLDGKFQVGVPQQAFNGADMQVSGAMTHQAYLNGQTGAYNVDRDLDSARVLFNSGAATYTLPNMVGANFRSGFTIRAAVINVAGIVFQASAGQTIRFGGAASSVGGTLTSVTVGSTVRLVLINSATWVTESFTGTWVPA